MGAHGKELQLPDLVDALGTLRSNKGSNKGPNKLGPSGFALGRIEERIAEAIELGQDQVGQDQVGQDQVRQNQEWSETFDRMVENFDDPPARPPASTDSKTTVKSATRTRVSRRIRLASLTACTLLLVSGATVTAAAKTGPDDALYAVKLKVEAFRLAMTASPQGRSERLNEIFADRLKTLRDIGPASRHVPTVLHQMDTAGISSVRLIEALNRSNHRTELATALNGLARSQAEWISDAMAIAPDTSQRALSSSLTVASMIVSSTDRILHPQIDQNTGYTGLIAGSLDAFAPMSLDPETKAAPLLGKGADSTSPAPANSTSSNGPNIDPANNDNNPTTPTDTDPDCDTAAGTICLRVPTLPGLSLPLKAPL